MEKDPEIVVITTKRRKSLSAKDLKRFLDAVPDEAILTRDPRKAILSKLSKEEQVIVKFWNKVDKTPGQGPNGDCWVWIGSRNERGRKNYGRCTFEGKSCIASRISFALNNPLDDIEGFQICHKCDNPPCVNPAHLFKGTASDNQKDKMAKGRGYGQKIGPEGTFYCSGCKEFLLSRYFFGKTGKRSYHCKKCSKEGSLRGSIPIRKALLKLEITEINELLALVRAFRAAEGLSIADSAKSEGLRKIYAEFYAKKVYEWQFYAKDSTNRPLIDLNPAPSVHLSISGVVDRLLL